MIDASSGYGGSTQLHYTHTNINLQLSQRQF